MQIKYEEVSLSAYGTVSAARRDIGYYLELDNCRRLHRALDRRTPNAFSFDNLPALEQEAIHKTNKIVH